VNHGNWFTSTNRFTKNGQGLGKGSRMTAGRKNTDTKQDWAGIAPVHQVS